MNYDDMTRAVEDAERTIRMAQLALQKTAKMLKGRLQSAEIDIWTLADLKKELKKFNAHTGIWKD